MQDESDEYVLAGEVSNMLHVSPKTVARWAKEGRLPYVRTLGGHRRFSLAKIKALSEALATDASMSVDDILAALPPA